MTYLTFHHGNFYFQIRVPRHSVLRYGQLIRLNLQTGDLAVAQPLALQLAGQWLQRFAAERLGAPQPMAALAIDPFHPSQNLSLGADEPFAPGPPSRRASGDIDNATGHAIESSAFEDSIDGLVSYWRRLHADCSPSTYRELTGIAREFRKVIGKSPSALERTDIAAYRDYLIGKKRQRATVAKKMGFIGTLLQAAFDAGFLPQNVARGLRIPKAKVPDVGRRSFTRDELRQVFTSPVYSRNQRYAAGGGEAAAWVPVLALVTGARLEELCQLRVDDVYRDAEHGPLLRICDEQEEQRVKTAASRRIVPLHPDVVAAGFLIYREDIADHGHDWLFPQLEPDHDGRRGGNFSKWWGRYLRSQAGCGLRDRRLVFHSFRHTFKSCCRAAGIPEEVHDALTGHAGNSVGRSYGEVPLVTRVEAMRKIQLPVKLPRIHE